MISIAVMALLALLAVALMTRPWWQRSRAAQMQRRAANVTAYETRLAEIEGDVAAGVLEAAAADVLKQELAARLLSDAGTAEATVSTQTASSRHLWALSLLLPVFAGVWYFLEGSWRTQELLSLAAHDPGAAQQRSVEDMVKGLATRLASNPDDAEGWAMLGRSYGVMERYAEAAMAYSKANTLSGAQNADWLVGEGEALAMSQDRTLTGRPLALFEAAIKLQPDHVSALWYAGLAQAQSRNYAQTLIHFRRLQTLELPPDLKAVLDERIPELTRLAGEPAPAVQPAAAPTTGVVIPLEVTIAADLQSRVEGRTLFVFAKAESGPPMPLAAQRLTEFHLPLKMQLDESMGMLPTLKLSQFDRWVVTARLTQSGGVKAESGDLEGSVTVSRDALGKPLSLRIDRQIP